MLRRIDSFIRFDNRQGPNYPLPEGLYYIRSDLFELKVVAVSIEEYMKFIFLSLWSQRDIY